MIKSFSLSKTAAVSEALVISALSIIEKIGPTLFPGTLDAMIRTLVWF